MARLHGSKNKIPSKRDLTTVSIETIALTMGFITKLIRSNELSEIQQLEVTEILKQMDRVLQSGKKHITEANKGHQTDLDRTSWRHNFSSVLYFILTETQITSAPLLSSFITTTASPTRRSLALVYSNSLDCFTNIKHSSVTLTHSSHSN